MIFTSYFIDPETKALNSLIKLSGNSLYIDALLDKISKLYIYIYDVNIGFLIQVLANLSNTLLYKALLLKNTCRTSYT